MIIDPTGRRRARQTPPWPLRPNALWIAATPLFLGALAWMVLIELPCGRDDCGDLEMSNQWTVFWRTWSALSVLTVAYVSRYWRWLRAHSKISSAMTVVEALLAPLMGALLIWVHLIAFANFTGPHSPMHFEGAIVDKRIHRSKSTTYDVIVDDVGSGREVAIYVDGSVYRSVRIGDLAKCDYRVGRWGLVYRWQYGEPKGCEFQRTAASAVDEPSRCRPVAGCGER